MILGEKIINIIHSLINENGEQQIFSLHCETSFHGMFYIELRHSLSGDIGILYQFYEGPRPFSNNLFMSMSEYYRALKKYRHHFSGIEEMMEYFNYRPFIIETQIDESDYRDIITLLEKNPLPSVQSTTGGLDGHDIIFKSYVNCTSTYSYWVYPPKGYNHLKIVTNIISKYLKIPYGDLVYKKNTTDL